MLIGCQEGIQQGKGIWSRERYREQRQSVMKRVELWLQIKCKEGISRFSAAKRPPTSCSRDNAVHGFPVESSFSRNISFQILLVLDWWCPLYLLKASVRHSRNVPRHSFHIKNVRRVWSEPVLIDEKVWSGATRHIFGLLFVQQQEPKFCSTIRFQTKYVVLIESFLFSQKRFQLISSL